MSGNVHELPLFSNKGTDDLNNHRPISVISVAAKVFERIAYDQLYAFIQPLFKNL